MTTTSSHQDNKTFRHSRNKLTSVSHVWNVTRPLLQERTEVPLPKQCLLRQNTHGPIFCVVKPLVSRNRNMTNIYYQPSIRIHVWQQDHNIISVRGTCWWPALSKARENGWSLPWPALEPAARRRQGFRGGGGDGLGLAASSVAAGWTWSGAASDHFFFIKVLRTSLALKLHSVESFLNN